jgi:sugar/nucleoside kinase (ribokinase family)
VLLSGYLKMPAWNDEVLIDLFRQARRRNSQVVLNVCAVQNSGMGPRRCLCLLEYAGVFLPNEDEARIITGETTLAR